MWKNGIASECKFWWICFGESLSTGSKCSKLRVHKFARALLLLLAHCVMVMVDRKHLHNPRSYTQNSSVTKVGFFIISLFIAVVMKYLSIFCTVATPLQRREWKHRGWNVSEMYLYCIVSFLGYVLAQCGVRFWWTASVEVILSVGYCYGNLLAFLVTTCEECV